MLQRAALCGLLSPRRASQILLVVKNLSDNAGDVRDMGSIPGSGRFPYRRACQPIPVSLLRESHGQKSHRVSQSQAQLKRPSMHKCPQKGPCKHAVWLSLEVKGTSHGFAVSQKGAPANGIVTSDL